MGLCGRSLLLQGRRRAGLPALFSLGVPPWLEGPKPVAQGLQGGLGGLALLEWLPGLNDSSLSPNGVNLRPRLWLRSGRPGEVARGRSAGCGDAINAAHQQPQKNQRGMKWAAYRVQRRQIAK